MKQWFIQYSLIDEPQKTKSWPAVIGWDKFNAMNNFGVLMTQKLGMSKDDFKVIDALEMI